MFPCMKSNDLRSVSGKIYDSYVSFLVVISVARCPNRTTVNADMCRLSEGGGELGRSLLMLMLLLLHFLQFMSEIPEKL